jgi:hypothetical protein
MKTEQTKRMNDLEQRIRDLPRSVPSAALDGRITKLLRPSPTPRPSRRDRPPLRPLIATAIAAGLAGFALGIGSGQWMTPPPAEPQVGQTDARPAAKSPETRTTLVHLTDASISAGLDFSQSLEPFRVEPFEQEGS